MVRRLRLAFGPRHGYRCLLAGESLGALLADGARAWDEIASRIFPRFEGDWMRTDGEPLEDSMITGDLYRLQAMLRGLDLIETNRHIWSPGPSARWLLPHATALAHLWGAAERGGND